MDFLKFIWERMLVLIPFLYVVGVFLKKAEKIPDKYIPLILAGAGAVFAVVLGLSTKANVVESIIQGVLCAGVSVLSNQAYKQFTKDE